MNLQDILQKCFPNGNAGHLRSQLVFCFIENQLIIFKFSTDFVLTLKKSLWQTFPKALETLRKIPLTQIRRQIIEIFRSKWITADICMSHFV